MVTYLYSVAVAMSTVFMPPTLKKVGGGGGHIASGLSVRSFVRLFIRSFVCHAFWCIA